MKFRYLLLGMLTFLHFSSFAKQEKPAIDDLSFSISVLLSLALDVTICEADHPEMRDIATNKHRTLKNNLSLVEKQTTSLYGKTAYQKIEKRTLLYIGPIAMKRRAQDYYSKSFCQNFLQDAEKMAPESANLSQTTKTIKAETKAGSQP
ncbi:MAG: hypothetical protein Q9M92_15815 [Enterobacterales bacterium]|nr:hypothetical protein [Enterobacterales bacterium]